MQIIEGSTPGQRILKVLLLCLIGLIFAPLLLLLGYRRLKSIPENDPLHSQFKWLLHIGSAIVILSVLIVIWKISRPQFGENLASVPWLRIPEASGISYYRTHQQEAYEFSIDEEHFRKALSSQNLQEIDSSRKILRYKKYLSDSPRETHEALITSGLYLELQKDGYTYQIIYDRQQNKAYFYRASN